MTKVKFSLKVEGHILDHTFLDVVTIDKSAQDLCNNVDNIILKNSSMCKNEGVNNKIIHLFGRIGPHSKHFPTICLDDEKFIKSSKPIDACMDGELCSIYCSNIGELHC